MYREPEVLVHLGSRLKAMPAKVLSGTAANEAIRIREPRDVAIEARRKHTVAKEYVRLGTPHSECSP
jgi:hypothetical protein